MPDIKKSVIKVEESKPSRLRRLRDEARQRTIGYILAAFGLIAGLAWNDAIRSFIEYLYPFGSGSMWAKFFYAIFITLIVVLLSIYLASLLPEKKDDK